MAISFLLLGRSERLREPAQDGALALATLLKTP